MWRKPTARCIILEVRSPLFLNLLLSMNLNFILRLSLNLLLNLNLNFTLNPSPNLNLNFSLNPSFKIKPQAQPEFEPHPHHKDTLIYDNTSTSKPLIIEGILQKLRPTLTNNKIPTVQFITPTKEPVAKTSLFLRTPTIEP